MRPSARSLNKRRKAISVLVTTLMLAHLELCRSACFCMFVLRFSAPRASLRAGSCESTPIGAMERILLQAQMRGERRLELAAHPGPE